MHFLWTPLSRVCPLIFTLFILALLPRLAVAEFLNDFSMGNPKALSLANAVTADPPGIDSIHFNPAGLAKLKGRHRLLKVIAADVKLKDEVGAQQVDPITDTLFSSINGDETYPEDPIENTSGSSGAAVMMVPNGGLTDVPLLAVPLGGMSMNTIGKKSTFGTAVYTPLALGYERDAGSPGIYQAEKLAITRLTYFSPTLAFQLTKKLAIGFGLNFSWHGMGIETKLRAPQFLLAALHDSVIDDGLNLELFGPYDDIARFTMEMSDSSSSQVNAGVLYEVNDWLVVGASYHSETVASLRGDYRLEYEEAFVNSTSQTSGTLLDFVFNATEVETGDVQVDFVMPKRLSFGASVILMPGLKMNVDVKKVYMSAWKEMEFRFSNNVDFLTIAGLVDGSDASPRRLTLPRAYEDAESWSFGFEYNYSDQLKLRWGYQNRERVVPRDRVDFMVPVGHGELYSIGASYVWSKRSTFDIAYGLFKSSVSAGVNGSKNGLSTSPTDFIYNPYAYLSMESSVQANLLTVSWHTKM